MSDNDRYRRPASSSTPDFNEIQNASMALAFQAVQGQEDDADRTPTQPYYTSTTTHSPIPYSDLNTAALANLRLDDTPTQRPNSTYSYLNDPNTAQAYLDQRPNSTYSHLNDPNTAQAYLDTSRTPTPTTTQSPAQYEVPTGVGLGIYVAQESTGSAQDVPTHAGETPLGPEAHELLRRGRTAQNARSRRPGASGASSDAPHQSAELRRHGVIRRGRGGGGK
ncbi:hypothetical protein HTV45_29390 [Streptomyces sp. CHD11]|uniref:hypothetical protein n=1 Tax=Streptomyces sp. CHD11 TaxID=2741325 RepID=UPI001BFBF79D|nr:hypothetical protein [Streptomyces sp. CHD11]MBT3154938.1 hypothetical protein [Streptomyces sp. CHD11]